MLKRILSAFRRDKQAAKPKQSASEFWRTRYAQAKASYDAARNGDEYKRIWANADRYDADSAHSRSVRLDLISKSRYEIGNNGFSDGIAQTSATDLIGVGPTLRMQTGSEGFNRMVEREWFFWCQAVKFRRKLWCMAHAKHSDGEAFGVIRRNPNVSHPIGIDFVLHEAEQCSTPDLDILDENYIDGIKFDEFGNPIWYDFLRRHPGRTSGLLLDPTPERVPARFVLHWFKLRRPGQHRAVPECASTLNTGAQSRRWRESTLTAAETAAMYTLFLEAGFSPDETAGVDPMSTLEIEKGMMTTLPDGYKLSQMDAKFPTTGHAEFNKSLINEQARPKSMPYNKAACDSSSYNYASGRLDHQTYYAQLDVDREDCNDLVLDPLFSVWFDFAVIHFGWLGGDPRAISAAAKSHVWDWPKHRVADVESEANANRTQLISGQKFLPRLFSDAGMDLQDEMQSAATAFGVSVEEIQKRLLDITLPAQSEPQGDGGEPTEDAIAAVLRTLERRRNSLAVKSNGVSNAN